MSQATLLQKMGRRKPIGLILQELEGDTGEEGGGKLQKVLTFPQLVALGLSATLGAGIFVVAGEAGREAGPPLYLSFLLACAGSYLSAMAYSEFACRIPSAGSAYTFAYASLGELAGFLNGWLLTFEYGLSAAAVAKGWASYLQIFLADNGLPVWSWLADRELSPGILTLSPLAGGLLIVLTFLASNGMQKTGGFQFFITTFNVLLICFFILVGMAYVQPANLDPLFPLDSASWSRIVAASAMTFFSYIGFDAVTTLSEEVQDKRDIPRAIRMTLLIVTFLYVGVALVLLGMVPFSELSEETPLADAFDRYNATGIARMVAFGAVTVTTATTLGSFLGLPRIFFRMARDGLFFAVFGQVDEGAGVPKRGVWLCGFGCFLIATFVNFEALVDVISVGTLIAFSSVASGVLILRAQTRAGELAQRQGEQGGTELQGVRVGRSALKGKGKGGGRESAYQKAGGEAGSEDEFDVGNLKGGVKGGKGDPSLDFFSASTGAPQNSLGKSLPAVSVGVRSGHGGEETEMKETAGGGRTAATLPSTLSLRAVDDTLLLRCLALFWSCCFFFGYVVSSGLPFIFPLIGAFFLMVSSILVHGAYRKLVPVRTAGDVAALPQQDRTIPTTELPISRHQQPAISVMEPVSVRSEASSTSSFGSREPAHLHHRTHGGPFRGSPTAAEEGMAGTNDLPDHSRTHLVAAAGHKGGLEDVPLSPHANAASSSDSRAAAALASASSDPVQISEEGHEMRRPQTREGASRGPGDLYECPGLPWLPLVAIFFNIMLICHRPWEAAVRTLVTIALGTLLWLCYGRRHSTLGAAGFQ